jgi:ATP-dependent RNA helicase DBP3
MYYNDGQGMCFSLPTLDDPFNDRNGKLEFQKKETKKKPSAQKNEKAFVKGKMKGIENDKAMSMGSEIRKSLISNNNLGIDQEKAKVQMNGKVGRGRQRQARENMDCPSKFLMYSLNEIEKALRHEGTYNDDEDESLFVSPWGVEFLKCYSTGKDILETSGSSCTTEQIAWVVSMAADIIVRKEEEDLSVPSPSFLFLVPSQEEAVKVCYLFLSHCSK